MVAALTGRGVSLFGSRVLEVRGRSSGEPRRTPVNLLELDGERYLVAPRGETQWARNLRVSGEGRLLRRASAARASQPWSSPTRQKAPVLRAYLKRWKFEVGVFFDGDRTRTPQSRSCARPRPSIPCSVSSQALSERAWAAHPGGNRLGTSPRPLSS